MPITDNKNPLCTRCGLIGEFRDGHRQCLSCERELGRLRNQTPEAKAKSAAYRDVHREKYRKQNVALIRRLKAERQIAVDKIKSVPCAECGETFPLFVMDFDHRDPSTKLYTISTLLGKTICPWERALQEIAKCDVVCANCHRLRSFTQPENSARRRLYNSFKEKPCLDCGKSWHYCQMDLDHVRGEKIGPVSEMRSKAAIIAEAAKCEAVCANCHRLRTQVRPTKGARRSDISTIDMEWHRKGKNPQTVVIPEEPQLTPAYRSWHALAGTMRDVDVAQIGGVSKAMVCAYRLKVGIKSYYSQTKIRKAKL